MGQGSQADLGLGLSSATNGCGVLGKTLDFSQPVSIGPKKHSVGSKFMNLRDSQIWI